MRSRQGIIDLFSTFAQFQADGFGGWAVDSRLRRSIQSCLAKLPETNDSEAFWSVYWHKYWQREAAESNSEKARTSSSIALGHLSAYLQEACYWSTQKAMNYLRESRYRFSDCFQVAIAEVPKILRTRNPDYPGSLKTYATNAFNNIIRDFLRQNREIDLCSDWGLLLKLSRKRLTEVLENAGLNPETIARYLLAWTCFETVYLPTKSPKLRQLPTPDLKTWEAIAALYNRQRHQLSSPGPDCSAETMQNWLTTCAKRARTALYPTITSLNAPKIGEDTKELQDDLADITRESLLSDLIAEEDIHERQTQYTQINQVLGEAIAKLDPTIQELLQLYYQQGLTQKQIADQLGVQQYTVSRKLTKTREMLLITLTKWAQETLHISPTSNVVKHISPVLEEWLSEKMKR